MKSMGTSPSSWIQVEALVVTKPWRDCPIPKAEVTWSLASWSFIVCVHLFLTVFFRNCQVLLASYGLLWTQLRTATSVRLRLPCLPLPRPCKRVGVNLPDLATMLHWYVYIYIYTCIINYIYIYVCMYIYIYIIHTYVHICMCVYVLCYVMLFCIVLCYIIVYYIMLYYIILHHKIYYIILYHII